MSKKARREEEKSYDVLITETAFKIVKNALKDISTLSITKKNDEGKEVINTVMTIKAIQQKAQMALDFVGSLNIKQDDSLAQRKE